MSSKKKSEKTGEKKAKKAGAPRKKMRAYSDSPAGHFADKVEAHAKALNKIGTRLFGWSHVSPIDLTNLNGVKMQLEALATQQYAPPRKKGGGRGINIVPGMRIYLKQEGIDMAKTMYPNIEQLSTFVGMGCDPNLKFMPIRINSGDLTSPPVGLIPRNMLSATPIAPAVATAAA